uniref:mitochondrial-processing peptidase subunit beta-like n=1 Tax=Osmia lignaria TaxID=473952 RepID=UPI0014792501|nr:mitochondrial-processing peptidase subunit beta-like [Osmia lignaria]
MMAISKYLCCSESNIMLKCIKRGYISMSNGCYKQFEAYKGISRNMAKLSNKSSNSEQIESCIVSSGMRLVCECRNSFTTTLGCFLPAGAMYEMPKERGSAIFLEHLLFRRTQHNNQEQLEKLLGEIGGKVAAIAMRDMFLFYGTVLPHEVDKLIQLFADVILNGIICDEDVEREKCVILYELSKMALDKEKVVMDYLPTVAYQDTALANGVYPETDTIKKFCTENLIEFRDRLFKTYFMTMVCTGSIGLEKFKRLVCKHFTIEEDDNELPIDLANNVQSCIESFQCRFSGCDLRLRDDDEELGYVAIGFEGPSYKEPEDHLILTVAKEIVGSWDKSCSGASHNAPYIAHCAFNTEFCYMYKSFFHNWAQCTSMWGCYFVSNKLDQENMVDLLQREWMKLCTTITQKEVLRAVNQCKLKDLIVLSDPTSRFFDIVQYIFRYGYYEPIQNRILEYEKITTDKLKETCEKYIYDQNPTVVAIGRIENLPHYYVIRNGMYLLRY